MGSDVAEVMARNLQGLLLVTLFVCFPHILTIPLQCIMYHLNTFQICSICLLKCFNSQITYWNRSLCSSEIMTTLITACYLMVLQELLEDMKGIWLTWTQISDRWGAPSWVNRNYTVSALKSFRDGWSWVYWSGVILLFYSAGLCYLIICAPKWH